MQVNIDTIILGIIFILAGLLTIFMGKKGSSLNPIAGYRTSWSMKSPETWVAANQYSGRALLIVGIICLLAGFLVWFKPLAHYGILIVTILTTIGIVITITATESYLRRNFNEDGTPKTPGVAVTGNDNTPPVTPPQFTPGEYKLPFSALDYVLEAASLLGIIIAVAAIYYYWPSLPEQIPQHYGAGGKVDAYGGKTIIFMLPVISLALYGFLSLIRWFSPATSGKSITPRQWRLTMDMVNWLKALTVWTFTYLSWMTLQIALGLAHSLHPAFTPIVLAATTLFIGFYAWKIKRS